MIILDPYFHPRVTTALSKSRIWDAEGDHFQDLRQSPSVYSELFTNPFLAWGKYRRGFIKTTLPISFQFHHAQMDGFEAARFLNGLQETIKGLTIR